LSSHFVGSNSGQQTSVVFFSVETDMISLLLMVKHVFQVVVIQGIMPSESKYKVKYETTVICMLNHCLLKII
jgi:hypothetical protein